MPPEGFEAAILASERPQTHTLDCGATAIGGILQIVVKNLYEVGD
jgi:hypothetical protein